MEARNDADTEETQAELINYMPGMPTLSSEPGRVERFIKTLFRRRGPLRPVARNRTEK